MHEASVQGDLPLLYELSLAIGRTLDPQATCLDFLGVLSAGCQLDGASIWWPIADETSPPSSELCLLAAIPRTQVGRERLPLAHPFRLHGRDGQACSFVTGDPEFSSLLAEHDGQVEACALVPLGDDGVLVMYSAAPAGFSPSALARLDAVLGKLATAIRNGMAFARLQRSEAGLRETNRRLAEAQRNNARATMLIFGSLRGGRWGLPRPTAEQRRPRFLAAGRRRGRKQAQESGGAALRAAGSTEPNRRTRARLG